MNSEGRCGKELSPSVSDIGDHCCWRQEWNDTGRCAWHAEVDEKPVGPISAVIDNDQISSTPICGAYLRDQFEQRRLSIQGLEFVDPDFDNVDLFVDLEDATFREGNLNNVDLFNAEIDNTSFEGVHIRDSDFDRIDAGTIEFIECSICETSFTEFSAENLRIDGCELKSVKYSKGTINPTITQSELQQVQIKSKCDSITADSAKFDQCDIINTVLKEGKFSTCEIKNLDLSGTRIGTDFQACEMYDIEFEDANINSSFNQSDIHLASFTDAIVSKLKIVGPCKVSGLSFDSPETEIESLELQDVENLFGLHLEDAKLSEVIFRDVACNSLYIVTPTEFVDGPRYTFENSTITGGYIQDFHPHSLQIDDVNLRLVNGNNICIPGKGQSEFSEVTISGCRLFDFEYKPDLLEDIIFNDCTLFRADFQEVTIEANRALENNILAYTDLSESDLSFARLTGSNLFGSDLTEANLEGADLRRASFEAATLIGADFRDARIDRRTSFDKRLHIDSMTNAKINGSDASVVHSQEKNGWKNKFYSKIHDTSSNLRRIYHSNSDNKRAERLEQQSYLLPCIDTYRDLQRLHSENGQPKLAREYRILSREARRKLALAKGKRVKWALSEGINRTTVYGESWKRLFWISGIVVLGSGLLYPLLGGIRFSTNGGQTQRVTAEMLPEVLPTDWLAYSFPLSKLPDIVVTFLSSMYFSVVTFTTLGYGDAQPVGPGAKLLAGFEAVFGAVLMAILVFVLTRKATR